LRLAKIIYRILDGSYALYDNDDKFYAANLQSITSKEDPFHGCFRIRGGRTALSDFIESFIDSSGFEYNASLNWIDVSCIKDFSGLFSDNNMFDGDISLWNVFNAKNMTRMFYKSYFTGNVSGWYMNPDCDVTDMFLGCDIPMANKPKCLKNRGINEGFNIDDMNHEMPVQKAEKRNVQKQSKMNNVIRDIIEVAKRTGRNFDKLTVEDFDMLEYINDNFDDLDKDVQDLYNAELRHFHDAFLEYLMDTYVAVIQDAINRRRNAIGFDELLEKFYERHLKDIRKGDKFYGYYQIDENVVYFIDAIVLMMPSDYNMNWIDIDYISSGIDIINRINLDDVNNSLRLWHLLMALRYGWTNVSNDVRFYEDNLKAITDTDNPFYACYSVKDRKELNDIIDKIMDSRLA